MDGEGENGRAALRTTLCVIGLTAVMAASCSGSGPAPAAPSQSPASGTAIAIGGAFAAVPAPGLSVGSGDLERCFQFLSEPGCFSGTRLRLVSVVAGVAAPSAPGNFAATSSGTNAILTWTAPASGEPVQSYVIEAGSTSGATNLANFPTGNALTTFSASSVGAGTYYLRVRAQNSGGVSGPSNESILVVGSSACTSVPNAPGGLATSASGTAVTLTWIAPVGGCAPTSYVLQAGSAAGLSNLANSNTGSTATSYVAAGVGAGTYYVRIRAVNANGQSAASNESTLVVASAPTYTVTGTIRESGESFGEPNATVTILDGPNAGRFTTSNREGNYALTGLAFASFSISVTASNFASVSRAVTLTPGVTTTTVDFTLTRNGQFSSFLGTWTGVMADNRGSVRLVVQDVFLTLSTIRRLTFTFTPGPGSPCFQRGGFNGVYDNYAGAGGGAFNVSTLINGGGAISMTGRTTSPSSAVGTYQASAQYCGALEDTTWTATRQ